MEHKGSETAGDDLEAIFARRFRQTREAMGMSQADMAREMSHIGYRMHQTAIAKIERGDRPLRLSEAGALASIVKCRLSDIVDTEAPTDTARLLHQARFQGALQEIEKVVQDALVESNAPRAESDDRDA